MVCFRWKMSASVMPPNRRGSLAPATCTGEEAALARIQSGDRVLVGIGVEWITMPLDSSRGVTVP